MVDPRPGVGERLSTGCCTSQASAPIQVALRADLGIHITAPPKPSPETQFVLTAMSEQERHDQDHWSRPRVMYSVDLLSARVSDIGAAQPHLKEQLAQTTELVNQYAQDHNKLERQVGETGRAVAQLTIDNLHRTEEDGSDTSSLSSLSPVPSVQ